MTMRTTGQILAAAIAAGGGTAVIPSDSARTLDGFGSHLRDAGDESGPSVERKNGPSLGGMAAEFFATPADGGRRVLACRSSQSPDPDCARETAELFCRGVGYAYAGNIAMETVGNRVYLADVLCKHSAVAITW